MEAATLEVSSLFENNEALTDELFSELVKAVRKSALAREKYRDELDAMVGEGGSQLQEDGVRAMKVAQGYYALCDYGKALEWLDRAGGGSQQCYLKGDCRRALKDYDGAIAEFEAAETKGWDSFDTAMAATDCLRRKGDLEGAEERLKRVSRVGDIRAAYHFQLGRLRDAQGRREETMQEYEQAVTLDNNHTEALFHLAYAYDLYGDEERAIDYYEQCLESGDMHVAALLNLAILYEEVEDYFHASQRIKKVLAAYPNHDRARMFLKDVEGSKVMYYDEEHERRLDRHNQVLEIPISDFELSVRSRNCLRKMNIRYLGDLMRVTESELLAYKNFGETSLQEIKAILSQKSLHLGQLLEDRGGDVDGDGESGEPDSDSLLHASVDELTVSVRARKCLQRLNINIIGDLVQCTEAELLGCKNFGQTSLVEIQQRLSDRGLSLRKLD